ncbi:energy transducer TonB [Hymenobacter koreensis]|uniref:TonB C-terminal domain-containing protein n=1 Tax=Hymenobacter koreensis TaxID=1084523 RepID=A0ABP8JI57_9BACT
MRPANLRPAPDPPAPHLPAAVLRQYAADTLTPAERRRVEDHVLDCDLCSDALDGFMAASAEATSPAALAALRQQLHTRVTAEPAVPRRAVAWWPAAAATVILLIAAFAVFRLWAPSAQVQEQSAPVAASAPAQTESAAADAAPAPAAPAAPVQEEAVPAVASAPAEPSLAAPRKAARKRPAYAVASRSRANQPTTTAETASTLSTSSEANAAADAGSVASAPVAAAPAAADAARLEEPKEAVAAAKVKSAAPESAMAMRRKAATAAPDSAPPSAAFTSPSGEPAAATKGVLPAPPNVSPLPAGGYQAYRTYLRRNLKYTDDARTDRAQGDVKVRFTVGPDGAVQNLQIINSVHPDLDEEALRLICEGPAWYPGIENGKRAARVVELNISFRLPLR